MRAALLALLLAGVASAQERDVRLVDHGNIVTSEGESLAVHGGAYMDSPTLLATGKELAALRVEVAELKASPAATPTTVIVVAAVALVVGFAGGAVLMVRVR